VAECGGLLNSRNPLLGVAFQRFDLWCSDCPDLHLVASVAFVAVNLAVISLQETGTIPCETGATIQ
jgi:hypothetical protein